MDLAGRTLLPSFIDFHGHLLQHGALATLVNLEHNARIDDIVTPPDTLLTIWAAVNRICRTGQSIGPEQRISTWEALRAVSTDAAYQYGEEESKGAIREEKRAELAILSADPWTTAPQDLRNIEVLETIKDGEVVHRT